MEEREPNPSEDPRTQEQSDAGYPEEQPGGAPGSGTGDQDERDTSDAPSPSSPNEGDADEATGNPDAPARLGRGSPPPPRVYDRAVLETCFAAEAGWCFGVS